MRKRESPNYKLLKKTFKGDYRIFRVVMASSDPLKTLSDIQRGVYSIREFLDMYEFLEVKSALQEEEEFQIEERRRNLKKGR